MTSLLALLVLISQTSTVFASMDAVDFNSRLMSENPLAMINCLHDSMSGGSVTDHTRHRQPGQTISDTADVKVNSKAVHSQNSKMKSCQQDCCDSQDCVEHCQNCISVVTGALIPALISVHYPHLSQNILIKSDQSPAGSNVSQLYRPPRNVV